MSVSFMGFNEGVLTFEAVSGVAAGKPVMISESGKVQAVSSGAFCGICLNVREGFAAVQLSGYVKVPFSGSIMPSGRCGCCSRYGRYHSLRNII